MGPLLSFLLFCGLASGQRTVGLSLSLSAVSWKQLVNYTAVVDPPPPAGSVTFFDNGVALAPPIPLELVNGKATAVYATQITSGPAVGDPNEQIHNIQAKYKQVLSAVVPLKVFQGRTKGTLSTDKLLYEVGDQVKITAVLKRAKGTGTFEPPPNNVKFYNNGNLIQVCAPPTVVAENPNNPEAKTFTCTFTVGSSAIVGEHEILMVYSGNPPNEFGGYILRKIVVFVCKPPMTDCDGDKVCDTDLSTTLTSCGACGRNCNTVFPNANTQCAAGVCTQLSCQPSFDDCLWGSGPNAGCETNLDSTDNHCGSCGHKCSDVFINADGHCSSGSCVFDTCDAGFGDCSPEAGPINGCETNLLTNDNHCGACATDCKNFQNSIGHCTSGACVVDTCKEGFSNCDSLSSNGCEEACPPLVPVADTTISFVENQNCADKKEDFANRQFPRAGNGNVDGHFAVASRAGLQLALRIEKRTLPESQVVNNGASVYRTAPCWFNNAASSQRAIWNYFFSVDFRNGVGKSAGVTLGDFDTTLKWENVGTSNSYFTPPLELKVRDFAKNLISGDVCSTCTLTSPYTFADGQQVPFTNCDDLAEKVVDSFTFVQDSTNIRFQIPTFDPTISAGLYRLTLSAIPKPAKCGLCPLEVSVLVMIDPKASCT